MRKLLRPQDILLLGLSGVIDFLVDLKDPFGTVGNAYKNLYGWVPKRYKKTNFRRLVQRSFKTGYIEKIIVKGEPCLRLTNEGKEKIQRTFSLVRFQNKKWDRKWRIVIFDIKEKDRKNRDVLRIKLRELGFGMIQESVWISPYDLMIDFREFIKNVGLEENVFIMEVNHLLAGDTRSLIERIWGLEDINKRYGEVLDALLKLHDRVKKLTGDGLNGLREKYIEILRDDPCLPKELLPEDWFREKVENLLRR